MLGFLFVFRVLIFFLVVRLFSSFPSIPYLLAHFVFASSIFFLLHGLVISLTSSLLCSRELEWWCIIRITIRNDRLRKRKEAFQQLPVNIVFTVLHSISHLIVIFCWLKRFLTRNLGSYCSKGSSRQSMLPVSRSLNTNIACAKQAFL